MGNPERERQADPGPPEEQVVRARKRLLRLLSFCPRTVQEVRRRLQRERFPAQAIEKAVIEAQERGWLDDESFAKLWIEDRLASKPKGPWLLKVELRAKGVSERHIDHALDAIKIDEEALIGDLLQRHSSRYQSDDPETRERKLYAFLKRRGFSPPAIRNALRAGRDETA